MGKNELSLNKTGLDDVLLAIIGGGRMGSLLAQAYAQNGVPVALVGRSEPGLKRALLIIENELRAAVEGKIFSPEEAKEIKDRIFMTADLAGACHGKNLMLALETAPEELAIKKEIFRNLDQLCPPSVVLATNTSCLDAELLARETGRPEKAVWMHYFFPPHKNHGGEFAPLSRTSPKTLETAAQFMARARKDASPLLRYRKGGASNTIFVALMLEAIRMVDEEFDVPSIEAAGKQAFGAAFGFLTLLDIVGLKLAGACLESFADDSDPTGPASQIYGNFFVAPSLYRMTVERLASSDKPAPVRWVSAEDANEPPVDQRIVDSLAQRFRAVAFMTAAEVVESGLIGAREADKLCRIAFSWQLGPFSLMNLIGVPAALQLVVWRMELSHRQEINFPIPRLLIDQAGRNEPWPVG
jgi:3-hydroxybutyryl-CoA dehydrogenase